MYENVLSNLQKYADQIYTRTYHDCTTNEIFCQEFPYRKGTTIRLTYSGLFERQYKQMIKIFITLCKNSTERYSSNILRIITLINHMYIEY